MAHDRQAQTTLNIPSIIVFSIFVFFLVRYFFFSPSTSNAAHGAAGQSPAALACCLCKTASRVTWICEIGTLY